MSLLLIRGILKGIWENTVFKKYLEKYDGSDYGRIGQQFKGRVNYDLK